MSLQLSNHILQSEQDTYKKMLELPPKGIIITNPQGLIAFFNTEAQKILKLKAEELERKNISKVIPEIWKDFQDLQLRVKLEKEKRVEWDDRTIVVNQIPILENESLIKVVTILQDFSEIEENIHKCEDCRPVSYTHLTLPTN